jgi:hypothetical protein
MQKGPYFGGQYLAQFLIKIGDFNGNVVPQMVYNSYWVSKTK